MTGEGRSQRVLNVALRLVGPDTGPEWDLLLEQDDGSVHPLMHITSNDAMGVGYLLSHAAQSMGLRLHRVLPDDASSQRPASAP